MVVKPSQPVTKPEKKRDTETIRERELSERRDSNLSFYDFASLLFFDKNLQSLIDNEALGTSRDYRLFTPRGNTEDNVLFYGGDNRLNPPN